jgi:hypothetical protein
MNHHFARFRSPEDAFAEKNGEVDPEPAVGLMLQWLKKRIADSG